MIHISSMQSQLRIINMIVVIIINNLGQDRRTGISSYFEEIFTKVIKKTTTNLLIERCNSPLCSRGPHLDFEFEGYWRKAVQRLELI